MSKAELAAKIHELRDEAFAEGRLIHSLSARQTQDVIDALNAAARREPDEDRADRYASLAQIFDLTAERVR